MVSQLQNRAVVPDNNEVAVAKANALEIIPSTGLMRGPVDPVGGTQERAPCADGHKLTITLAEGVKNVRRS